MYRWFAVVILVVFVVVAIEKPSLLFKRGEVTPAKETPTLTAKAWGIFNPQTGEVFEGVGVDEVRPIASITKLLSAYVTNQHPQKNERFLVEYFDVVVEGESGKLWYGDEVTAYELMYPMLIESSNDAAEAVRRHFGNSFYTDMGKMIEEVELEQTIIADASGLSPQNVSSVEDLARLYAFLLVAQPHILDITTLNTYVGPHNGYRNNNPAHTYEGFIGGKQGYLPEAGYTFLGAFEINSTLIGIVLLGSASLQEDIKELYTYIRE